MKMTQRQNHKQEHALMQLSTLKLAGITNRELECPKKQTLDTVRLVELAKRSLK